MSTYYSESDDDITFSKLSTQMLKNIEPNQPYESDSDDDVALSELSRQMEPRLKKQRYAAKRYRGKIAANAIDLQEHRHKEAKRLRKRRSDVASRKKQEKDVKDKKRASAWRRINQFEDPENTDEEEDIKKLSLDYKDDLQEFKAQITSPLSNKVCNVCGIRKHIKKTLNSDDSFFDCILAIPEPTGLARDRNWWMFPSPAWDKSSPQTIQTCDVCYKSLSKERVPLMSRASYPIGIAKMPPFLRDLSDLEQALISPVLPMIFIYQHHGSGGQFKSFGQSIALQNDIEIIAKVLPRRPEDVCFKIHQRGVWHKIRPLKIRQALDFFKSQGHPAFVNIEVSEENHGHLCAVVEKDKFLHKEFESNDTQPVPEEQDQVSLEENLQINADGRKRMMKDPEDLSPSERLLNKGQNQIVENETAAAFENVPVGAEPLHYTEALREATLQIMSQGHSKQLHRSHVTEDWHLKFPLLLPDGRGGPNDCTDPSRKLSLEDWIKYVIQIEDLDFSRNILFILYANNVVRRRKITGFACNKTISASVRDAVEELTKLVHERSGTANEEHYLAGVQALLNRISFHTNDITGSVQDKATHRQNILSMYNDDRHGAPQLFVTLSAAESYWPETFVYISNGHLTLEQAKTLGSAERADLIAKSPVRVTQAYKQRVDAFIKLITKGKSRPFGNILHYISTAEWQARLTEHIHLIIWCDSDFTGMKKVIDAEGNVQLADNSSLVKEIERYVCMQVPRVEISVCTPMLPIARNTHEAITREPINDLFLLFDVNKRNQVRSDLRDLVRACNIHRCNAYCTQKYTRSCKSGFPHREREVGDIVESVDAKLNTYYRAHLKRNDTQVNNYNVPILNAWRANMDVTALLGDAFGACVYVAYYTSKKDKSADLHKIIKKVRNMEVASNDDDMKKNLNRILLAVDSCKATGAPEAASNLLGYKHHFTSTSVERMFHRSFITDAEELQKYDQRNLSPSSQEHVDPQLSQLEDCNSATMLTSGELREQQTEEESDNQNPITVINRTLSEMAGDHPLFGIHVKNRAGETYRAAASSHSRITNQYLSRPRSLEHLSHQDYYQNYKVTAQRRQSCSTANLRPGQMLDMENRLVEKRSRALGHHVILDLKYRPSPNTDDEQWCAGALALHISYRSTKDILRPHEIVSLRSNVSFCKAYKFWIELKNGTECLKFPKLKAYETNLKTLQATNNNTGRPRGTQQATEGTKTNGVSSDSDSDKEDDILLDFDDIQETVKCNLPTYPDGKTWSGQPSLKHAVFGSSMDSTEQLSLQSHSSLRESIATCRPELDLIYARQHPPEKTMPLDDEQNFKDSIASGTPRKEIALRYKNKIKRECRTATQEDTFDKAATALEQYYFSPKSSQTMIVTGVAGSGKSYVTDKLAIYASLLLDDNDHPYDSPDAILQREYHNLSSSFTKSVARIDASPLSSENAPQVDRKVTKKRMHKVAYSGAAAGVIGGYTIHRALGLTRKQLTADVMNGTIDLPHFGNNPTLTSLWKDIKVLAIDEVYFCDAAFISIISQRLCQLKDRFDAPFGGLFLVMLGDPQQCKALSGEPLYKYVYYFPVSGNTPELVKEKLRRQNEELLSSSGAEKGLKLYGSCTLYCHMPESQRLADIRFQDLTHRAASYHLTQSDISELNKYVRPKSELYSEKWLSAIWILPTWDEINLHHAEVARFMAKTRGVIRVWSRPTINTANLSEERRRRILYAYYTTTSTDIGRDFKEPLPYMDLFPGQILCLKENFVPSLRFYKNSRVVIVGVYYHDKTRMPSPVASASEAVNQAMHPDGPPEYEVLVRFYSKTVADQYKGVSAIADTPGVFILPWKTVEKKFGNASLSIRGIHAHPGNAGTGHGSQGATYVSAVASVTRKTNKWYGWPNVAISRAAASEFALRYTVSLDIMHAQKGQAAIVRQELQRLSYFATPRHIIERDWESRQPRRLDYSDTDTVDNT